MSEWDDKTVKPKDGSYVCISKYREAELEKLVGMFASLSEEALRWTRPPYNETIRKLSKDKNLIMVANHQKIGFRIEGIQKEAYYGEDWKYHDKVLMGLLP